MTLQTRIYVTSDKLGHGLWAELSRTNLGIVKRKPAWRADTATAIGTILGVLITSAAIWLGTAWAAKELWRML